MKYIAALLMLIDHIGMVFYPNEIIWRILGRLAMPIFAYGIACGFLYTSSLKKYTWRLFLFASVSQLPFYWMQEVTYGKGVGLNIGFTFLLAIGCLWLLNAREGRSIGIKVMIYLGIGSLLFLAEYVLCDYGMYGIIVVISFYQGLKKNDLPIGYILFSLVTIVYSCTGDNLVQIFAVLSIVIIERLKERRFAIPRFFFYIFYPMHMFIITVFKSIIG